MTTRDMVSSLNTNLHPGFILLTNIPLSARAGSRTYQQLIVEVCTVHRAVAGAFFVALRCHRARRFDALLFTGIAGASATSLFLVRCPRPTPRRRRRVVIMMSVVAWDKDGRAPPVVYIVAGLFARWVSP